MLRSLCYLAVLVVSFFVTLWVIDRYQDAHSPLLGTRVTYYIMADQDPEVCATTNSLIQFTGKICEVSGGRISVLWGSLANTTNHQVSCGQERVVRWPRKEGDPQYNAKYLGSCGVGPRYFGKMPDVFDPNSLRAAAPN
jgi:hypothetical protein